MGDSEQVTFDEFIKRRSVDINDSNRICQGYYQNRLSQELKKCKLQETSRKHLWRRAYKIVSGSQRVLNAFGASVKDSTNADDIARDLLNGNATLELSDCDKDIFETVKNVIEEYQGLFEEAFLLLNAPKNEHEKHARDIHLNDFYDVVVRGQETDKYPSMPIIVSKYKDIVVGVQCFMRCQASKAKRATIVYNGHGKASGELSLGGEPRSPHNSTMLQDIHQLWVDNKNKFDKDGNSICLPSTITVVFAQCYGFIHQQSPEQKQAINVVALATPQEPETKYENTLDTGRSYIKESVHFELAAYAQERSTESSDDASSDASTSHTDDDEMAEALGIMTNCDRSFSQLDLLVPSLFVSSALRSTMGRGSHPGSITTRKPSMVLNETRLILRNWKLKKRPQYTCEDALRGILAVNLGTALSQKPPDHITPQETPSAGATKGSPLVKRSKPATNSALSALAKGGLSLFGANGKQ